MWVLVVFDPETNDVKVRGPWNHWKEAEGAAQAYREMAEARGHSPKTVIAVSAIQPMVYFNPHPPPPPPPPPRPDQDIK